MSELCPRPVTFLSIHVACCQGGGSLPPVSSQRPVVAAVSGELALRSGSQGAGCDGGASAALPAEAAADGAACEASVPGVEDDRH